MTMTLIALTLTLLWSMAGGAVGQQPQGDPFAAQVRTSPPRSPEDERRGFRLPPGFEAQLVAAEPDIYKPLNLAFDARGRLWVSASIEYPYAAPAGRDHIQVLEDTDGDGRADRITTFADGLNIPIGLYPYKDGVICWSIPNIWFLRDTDGDGKADKWEKLYGPMGYERDTHGMNNAFRRGFDGWLYACHGFNNETRVSGADGHEIRMQSGNTYRMRLDGSRVEHFTHGQVNPFGMAFDSLFNVFTADCHSKPLYQLVRGGCYPSFGKPHDGLGFVPQMMEHSHGSTAIAGVAIYEAEDFPSEYRGNAFSGNVMTSRINRDALVHLGSTIAANELPDFLVADDPWFRPVDIQLGPDGALYVADFYNRIIGHYEVPLDHPGRDRDRGRIWRIVYTGDADDSASIEDQSSSSESKTEDGESRIDDRDAETSSAARQRRAGRDLTALPPGELIAALGDSNLTVRMLAMNHLADVVGSDCVPALQEAFRKASNPRQRSHALWVLWRLDQLESDDLSRGAGDDDRTVAAQAMKILAETAEWSGEDRQLVLKALRHNDPFVRRAAADALGQHPQYDHIRPLLPMLKHGTRTAVSDSPSGPRTETARSSRPTESRAANGTYVSAADPLLRHAARIALRNQLAPPENFHRLLNDDAGDLDIETATLIADVALAIDSPEAGSFLVRHVQSRIDASGPAASEKLQQYVAHAARTVTGGEIEALVALVRERFRGRLEQQHELLASMIAGLDRRGEPPVPSLRTWAVELAAELLSSVEVATVWANHPNPAAGESSNPWFLQQRQTSEGTDATFLCSLPPGGERLTGVLRSPAFTVPPKLSFFLAGHRGFPNQPAHEKNVVRLRDAESGASLAQAFPPRNDIALKVEWDLSAHAGRTARLELVDGDSGAAYAWLAAGRFEPPVVDLPQLDPRTVTHRRVSAAAIAERLGLSELRPALAALLNADDMDVPSRSAAARAVAALDGDSTRAALAVVVGRPELGEALREQLCQAIGAAEAPVAPEAVKIAFQMASGRVQTEMALTLATDRAGVETLLTSIEQGRAAARLLQEPAIVARLQASPVAGLDERVQQLTAGLPSRNAEIQRLIDERIQSFRSAGGSADRGATVFEKNCAACHRIGEKGATIGPQLDGIGGRGLERLIEDILNPNRNVDVAFRATTIVLDSGKTASGLVRREEGAVLVLADTQGKEFTVPKDQIIEQVRTTTSLMPTFGAPLSSEGEGALSHEDFHDLATYLMSQRTGGPPPAREKVE